MKRITLILTILICSFTTYAQDTTIVNDPFITEEGLEKADEIVSKYADGIRKAFNEGVEHAVPAVKDGFALMVKYEIAKGITYLIPFFTFIIFFIVFVPCAIRSPWGKSADLYGIIAMISGIIAGFSLIISFFTIGDAILHLLAPEYYAIKDIIGMFK